MLRIFFGVSIFAITVFVGVKVYPIIHGPVINLATIDNGAQVTDPMIRVSGKARFTKNLLVNGAPVATAPDGTFDQNLILNPGYNLLTFEGNDRFGSTSKKDFVVVLAEQNPSLTIGPLGDTPATY